MSTAHSPMPDAGSFSTSAPPHKVPALDGLRGIASLMVLAFHFGPHIVRYGSPFEPLLLIPRFLFQGVSLFFVLSGFLICWILVTHRDSPRYYSTFYARRVFRILPLYALVVGSYAAFILTPFATTLASFDLMGPPLPLWTYVLFVQNFAMAAAGHFGPLWLAASWSLAVEEQFYFLFPWAVRRLDDRRLAILLVAVVILTVCLRAAMQKFQVFESLARYTLLVSWTDALAIGALLAIAFRSETVSAELRRWSRKFLPAALVLWLVYPLIPHPQAIRMAFLYPTVDALLFGGLLAYLVTHRGSPRGCFRQMQCGCREGGRTRSTCCIPSSCGLHSSRGTSPIRDCTMQETC